jgi:hypothetical protein
VLAPPVPSPPVAPPAPVAPPVAEPPPIVIHHAHLRGQFESKQGATITIHALLMMTKTQPVVGNKGTLYFAPADTHLDSDWIPLGEVEVKKPLDAAGNLQVKILEDDRKFMIPGGKAPTPLVKKARVMLRWEW